MVKKKEVKMKQVNKKFKVKILGAAILLLVLISLVSIYKTSVNDNKNKELSNRYPPTYDEDTCRCVMRERFTCLDGFELNSTRKLCISNNGSYVTNVVLSCSEYECSGTAYKFNTENKMWEVKTTTGA